MVIPDPGTGCSRVTHPSAAVLDPEGSFPHDLHVLGPPLAFTLSQDQTLKENLTRLKHPCIKQGCTAAYKTLLQGPSRRYSIFKDLSILAILNINTNF